MARWRPAASSWRAAFVAASTVWALLLLAAPFAASRAHASPLASVLIVGVYSIGRLVCHQLPERSYHVWAAQMPVCARCAGIYVGAAVAALFAALFRTAEAVRHGTGEAVRHGTGEAVRHGTGEAVRHGTAVHHSTAVRHGADERHSTAQHRRAGDAESQTTVPQGFRPSLADLARALRPDAPKLGTRGGGSPANAARVALACAVVPTVLTLAYEWTTGDMPSHAVRAAAGVPIGVVVAWLVVAAADNQVD